MASVDVLLVSLGSTGGWRAADAELAASLQRAGATVAVAQAQAPRERRTLALTDLTWAHAARRAALTGIEEHSPRAVLYSTVTAALLWPRPGAVRFDSTAAVNRPGRHGVWQRPVERARLAQAPLLVPMSDAALAGAPIAPSRAVTVPVPVEPSGPPAETRDVAAVMYAANPVKKGLDRVLEAWRIARHAGEELVVAGTVPREPQEGVRWVGRLPASEYRALLRRARVFVTAPVREDHGLAQLEALADGCLLVTTEAAGPYPALELARSLDARLVGDDLPRALRAALDDPAGDYVARARELLAPLSHAAVDEAVARELLPALLATSLSASATP
jgi:hypothetical protein